MPDRVEHAGDYGHSGEMFTVGHLIDAYDRGLQVAVNSGHKSSKTREWYGWQFKKLRSAAGTMPAAELRIWHLHAVRITHHFARAIRSLYAWSTDNDLTPKNPFTKLEIPKCGQRERTVTRSELCRLMQAAPRRFRRYLFLLAHTMARPSEIRLLRWSEIDFEKRVVSLRDFKAKDKRRDGLKVRSIPLDRRALLLLSRMARRRSSEYVFDSIDGSPWSYNAVRSMMRKARRGAGLEGDGERIVCYTLRHTGATNAMRAGVQTTLLAKMLGHAKVTTTQRYQHPTTDDLVDAIDQVERAARDDRRSHPKPDHQ
jgi:integrase